MIRVKQNLQLGARVSNRDKADQTKSKGLKRSVFQIVGDCFEEFWGFYGAVLEINTLSQLRIIMPALFSRTGMEELTFILRPIQGGWTSYCPYHGDYVTFNVELSEGHYHYCDDDPYGLQVEWRCKSDLEKKLRDLHRKMLMAQNPITKKAA
jgi:hypothetical protein